MLHKNDVIKADILDMGFDGEGITKVMGYTVFVKNAVKGDEAFIKILKVNKSYAYAKTEKIIKPSDMRREAVCNVFPKCGGCALMHIKYENQLEFKENIVKNNMYKYSGLKEGDFEFNKIVGADEEYFYRNKVSIPLQNDGKNIKMGFFAKMSHRVVPFDKCYIQNEKTNEISKICFDFIKKEKISIYDEKTHRGVLRNIFIRCFDENAVLCLVANTKEKIKNAEVLFDKLKKYNVTGIVQNINTKKSNTLLGDENITLCGNEYVFANIGDLKFKISPNSFFQVNTKQTEKLYTIVKEYAGLSKNETVLDLYCGVGTITLFMAKDAGSAVGVEITKQAVENAKENAKINGISNASFYDGDCKDIVLNLKNNGMKFDTVVVDPPRKGCSTEVINLIEEISPKKVVYVSCNSATLARDVKIFCEKGYKLKKLTPVDMFPQSCHVETIVLLQNRNM